MCSLLTRALIFTVIEPMYTAVTLDKTYGLMQFLVLVDTFDERIKVIRQGEGEGRLIGSTTVRAIEVRNERTVNIFLLNNRRTVRDSI